MLAIIVSLRMQCVSVYIYLTGRIIISASKIHVDCLTGFEQSHLHVEFHQKVIESWVGVESEHIA